jgi:hypothetical protein
MALNTHALKRDVARVKASYKQGNDGSIIATKPTKLIFPERFLEKSLAEIGVRSYVAGCFAHVVEDEVYAVVLAVAMIEVKPSSIATIKIEGDSYIEMSFEPGDRLIVQQEAIQDKFMAFHMYNEIISKGHVPWYLHYDDRIKLLFTANKLAGMDLLSNHGVLELNAAAISRDPKDINRFYRHAVESYAQADKDTPISISLMSVSYGTTNATSRLMGAYWEQGLNSELANPSTQVENVERLLRT